MTSRRENTFAIRVFQSVEVRRRRRIYRAVGRYIVLNRDIGREIQNCARVVLISRDETGLLWKGPTKGRVVERRRVFFPLAVGRRVTSQ